MPPETASTKCRCGRPSECIVPVITDRGEHLTTYRGCHACYLLFRRLLQVNLRAREVQTAGEA